MSVRGTTTISGKTADDRLDEMAHKKRRVGYLGISLIFDQVILSTLIGWRMNRSNN